MKKYLLLILLFAVIISCKNQDLTQPASSKILNVKALNNNVPADNYSYIQVVATVDSNINNKFKNVQFNAGSGTFQGSGSNSYTTSFNGSGKAIAYLKNNIAGPVTISVSTDTITASAIVNFANAWPNSINLSPSSSTLVDSLGPAKDIQLSAQLIRDTGTASTNLVVIFTATDASGKSRGTFYNVTTTNSSGIAIASYGIQDTATINKNTYRGLINFKAQVIVMPKDTAIIGVNKILVVN